MSDKKLRRGMDLHQLRKSAKEFIDMDYVGQLSEEEKAWLSKFNREYYQASFKNDDSDLHNDQEKRRELYRKNNERNRDVWNKLYRTRTDLAPFLTDGEDDE